jgi:acetyl esterase/lipase
MRHRIAGVSLAIVVAAFGVGGFAAHAAETPSAGLRASIDSRLNRLEAEITAAEDVRDIKKLQRAYGYYLDKGMWEDLAAFFTDDAVANYPAGIFVGHDSIRQHLFMNVGGGKMGDIGLGDNRLYNHMNIQPVVHLDPGGKTAKGRWRAFAMFGSMGGGATWAEGVYELQYAKVNGVWKISKLDYYSGFGAPYATGWAGPAAPTAVGAPGAGAPVGPGGVAGGSAVPPAAPTAATRDTPNAGTTTASTTSAVTAGGASAGAASAGAGAAGGAAASATPGASPPARPRRALAHPPDRERKMECDGFPAACIAPFHYENPGTSAGGTAWDATTMLASIKGGGDARKRAAELAHRAMLLQDEQTVENLQRIYGYYLDRAMWDQIADLFAEDGTIEMAQQGVYVGRKRVREFLGTLGRHGLMDGWLNDHIQLQPVVDVAPDGKTARIRSRELAMTGKYQGEGTWSEGVYENTFVKQDGVWKFESLHFYPTFITDYDKGWAKDAQPAQTASNELPPDRPPTELYEIYPKAHVPPYHYRNPVTGEPPHYPAVGGPSKQLAAAALESAPKRFTPPQVKDVDAALTEAERVVGRVKDFHELDNLSSAYGYYLDKNLWNNLADLFAQDGSIELAQRGVYKGQKRVREFLLQVFGRGQEGPVAGRLGNHVQMQPVIHVADDGQSAKIRIRMIQQLAFGPRASMGASVYENEAVKENGVWKLSVDHTYNTFTAAYIGGWTKGVNTGVPGPSKDLPPDAPPTLVFKMFPSVYDIAFHYANPVSGRTELPPLAHDPALQAVAAAQSGNAPLTASAAAASAPPGMPPEIAVALREIGPKIEGRRTAELYAPLQPKEPYQNVSLTRDISYGPHERQTLDVFVSPEAAAKGSKGKPVVVFIYGGGFSGGSKHGPNSPFYDNVGLWAVSHGFVGVTINYRLAPQFTYPSGIEDVTRVVDWLHGHVAEYGGDPKKIFLWGHSSGAAHTAGYLANATNTHKKPGVAGAILTSGFYELGDTVSVWKAYYGEDVSKYKERSSLTGLVKSSTPLLVTDAELDPDTFKPESDKLAEARAKAGKPVQRVKLAGHSHLSELYAVNTGDATLSGPVLEFVRSVSAKVR